MHLKTLLKNKFRSHAVFGFITCMIVIAMPVHAAWDDQPKLGHSMTPLPKPVAAPAFTLEDMDEEKHSLADHQGKVIMLNFWATWCPPFRREMPSLERLYQNLNGKDFTVIAVNQMESGDHVFAYIGQLEVDPSFTILFDKDSSVSRAYSVQGLPTSYLIDKKGKVRFRAIGGREFDHPEVVKQIQELINE